MNFSFSKKDKLKSKKLVERLFEEGQSISNFPLRLVYIETSFKEEVSVKTAVSVSKRNFKNAVDRNRIKRLLRESIRLNKNDFFNNLTTQYALMILYIGKEKPTQKQIDHKMKQALQTFVSQVSE